MKQTKSFQLSAAALLTALVITIGVPAAAGAQAVQSSAGSTSTVSSSDSASSNEASTNSTQSSDTTDATATADSGSSNLHSRGQSLLTKYRQARKTHTAAEKQQLCKTHEKSLQGNFDRLNGNAERDQSRINAIFTKAQNYQKSKNVTAANFDNLVTTAKTAQAKSSNSIAAMKTATPTIDCSGDNAANVATYKVAVQQTRDNLKAYRTAVRAVLQSLITAKGSN